MFGSQILEVAIGLIMVFLLVSLILTAVRETIESWTRTRSRDLERAIAELLDDHSGDGLRKRLYEHPLIYGLFQGPVSLTDFAGTGASPEKAPGAGEATDSAPAGSDPTKVAPAEGEPAPSEPFERTDATRLPSYIPRETFALALEHLLADGKGSGRIATAYAALDRAAGGNPALIRKGIEDWYDAAMDRASGWYRRRTQRILFWLGLAVALLLNINAFTIAQYLSTSDAARQQIVALGDAYIKDQAVATALAKQPPPPPAQGAGGNGSQAQDAQNAQTGGDAGNESAGNAAAEGGSSGGEQAAADTANASDPAGSNASVNATASVPLNTGEISRSLQSDLVQAGLPLGWNAVQLQRVGDQLTRQSWGACIGFLVMLIAGYLAVAFAATMGAPFWFDLLGKFMVVRSTVKPKEKSPDEASKDAGNG